MVVWTAALFIVVEPIVGHVIEPMLYGHSSGLSPVAVLVAATFRACLVASDGIAREMR
jgi:predicted PurR-regulated permease PerM